MNPLNDSFDCLLNINFLLPSVFEFLVTVQQSEASVRCNLQGLYWLQVGEEMFMLKDTESKHGVMEWPYKLLRRYGRDKVSKEQVDQWKVFFHDHTMFLYVLNSMEL